MSGQPDNRRTKRGSMTNKIKPIAKGKDQKALGAVIAIGNQKGGVGKSTNCVHLAAALGEKGYKVLIIDLDPTAGATKLLGVNTESYVGTFELLTGEEKLEEVIISENLPEGVDLIPSRMELSELDQVLNKNKFLDKTSILDAPLKAARKVYDIIFLDTPPSPGDIATVAAYASADWFLLSVFPQPLAIAGLYDAIKDIASVRKKRNRNLEVLGVLICAVKRTSKLWMEIENLIKHHFPGRGFKSTISQSVVIERISGDGKTLFQDAKLSRHKCTDEYRELANEVEARIINREKFISTKPYKQAANQ